MKQYLVTVLVGYDKETGEPITETVPIAADNEEEAKDTASFRGKYQVLSCEVK